MTVFLRTISKLRVKKTLEDVYLRPKRCKRLWRLSDTTAATSARESEFTVMVNKMYLGPRAQTTLDAVVWAPHPETASQIFWNGNFSRTSGRGWTSIFRISPCATVSYSVWPGRPDRPNLTACLLMYFADSISRSSNFWHWGYPSNVGHLRLHPYDQPFALEFRRALLSEYLHCNCLP